MKKIVLIALCLSTFNTSKAQLSPDGTIMPNNVTFTDIKGTGHDFYSYTSQGKHILLDLFMTTCGYCWAHHNAGYFDQYHTAHEIPGSTEDAVVLGFEVHNGTTQADLEGTGPNTIGNWLATTDYSVSNTTDNNTIYNTIKTFIPSTSFGTPQLILICPDRSFYKLTTSMTYADLRAKATSTCATASLESIKTPGSVSNLFPNPAKSLFSFTVTQTKNTPITLSVTNAMGQAIEAQAFLVYTDKGSQFQVNTSTWEQGVYLVRIETENGVSTRSLVID